MLRSLCDLGPGKRGFRQTVGTISRHIRFETSACQMEGRATEGSEGRKAVLTQNREREPGPREKDLGPHAREKPGGKAGPWSRGRGPCSVLEELWVEGDRRSR